MPSQYPTFQIPDEWSASWFRLYVAEVLSKGDARNIQGVTVTFTGNSVATIDMTASVAAELTAHNVDPFSHVDAFNAHVAEADPHAQYPLKSATTVIDAAGGATVDTEARTQLNELLAALRVSGVIGT